MEWTRFFSTVPDFRINRRKRHLLSDILGIALCAVLSGADDYEDMAEYGRQKMDFLREFLVLPNGIPSHDTFNRVFKFLDTKAFGECLYRWSGEILASVASYQVAIDGKVLRATARSGHKKSGICVVSAWASDHRLVLGQQRVEGKSNEKQAIPDLLDSLDLTGAIVSIDAVACQASVAGQIRAKEAHYLLALKQNQQQVYEQVWSQFQARQGELPRQSELETGSGRLEKRTAYVLRDLRWLDSLGDWPGIKSVVWVVAERAKGGGITIQNRLYLSSLEANPAFMLDLTRGHWGIENSLHWQLDTVRRCGSF